MTGIVPQIVESRGRKIAAKVPRRVRLPLNAERRFEAASRAFARSVIDQIERVLFPVLPTLTDSRVDHDRADVIGDITRILRDLLGPITATLSTSRLREAERIALDAFEETADFTRGDLAEQLAALLGVDVFVNDPDLLARRDLFTRETREALAKIAADAVADTERIVLSNVAAGRRSSAIVDQIRQRLGVTEARARFIARDQTSTLQAQLTKARQEDLGIGRYIWRTSLDERVRASHARLDGRVFSWDDPPTVGSRRVHPGEDYNCRCTAAPYIKGVTKTRRAERQKELTRKKPEGGRS